MFVRKLAIVLLKMALQIKCYIVKWLSLIILKKSTAEVKCAYRKLEKIRLKMVKLQSHLSFNETCIINNLLPTYTNIYILVFARGIPRCTCLSVHVCLLGPSPSILLWNNTLNLGWNHARFPLDDSYHNDR